MVGLAHKFEVKASNIEYMAIPYSILDGSPLCIFKFKRSCSHLISNMKFTTKMMTRMTRMTRRHDNEDNDEDVDNNDDYDNTRTWASNNQLTTTMTTMTMMTRMKMAMMTMRTTATRMMTWVVAPWR